MNIVSETEFRAFVQANCPMATLSAPRQERDGEYSYNCYDNDKGEEVAFVSYKTDEEPVYSISA